MTESSVDFANKQYVYVQIRLKEATYFGQETISIHFSNVSHDVQALKLEEKVSAQENMNEHLVNYQVTLAHEYRTPVSNSLMILDEIIENFFLT